MVFNHYLPVSQLDLMLLLSRTASALSGSCVVLCCVGVLCSLCCILIMVFNHYLPVSQLDLMLLLSRTASALSGSCVVLCCVGVLCRCVVY